MKVRRDSDITWVCKKDERELVNMKTILNYLIIINMNIFLTVTTFHILQWKPTKPAPAGKRTYYSPPLPPWTKPSLRDECREMWGSISALGHSRTVMVLLQNQNDNTLVFVFSKSSLKNKWKYKLEQALRLALFFYDINSQLFMQLSNLI